MFAKHKSNYFHNNPSVLKKTLPQALIFSLCMASFYELNTTTEEDMTLPLIKALSLILIISFYRHVVSHPSNRGILDFFSNNIERRKGESTIICDLSKIPSNEIVRLQYNYENKHYTYFCDFNTLFTAIESKSNPICPFSNLNLLTEVRDLKLDLNPKNISLETGPMTVIKPEPLSNKKFFSSLTAVSVTTYLHGALTIENNSFKTNFLFLMMVPLYLGAIVCLASKRPEAFRCNQTKHSEQEEEDLSDAKLKLS